MAAAEWDVISEQPVAPAGGWEVASEEQDPAITAISDQMRASEQAFNRAAMSHQPGPPRVLPTGEAAYGALSGGTLILAGAPLEAGSKALEGGLLESGLAAFGVDTRAIGETGRKLRTAGQEEIALTKPKAPGTIERNVLGALQSAPTSVAAVATTLMTGNPSAGAFIAGLSQYGGGYAEVADRPDLTPEQKQSYAVVTGLIESVGELGPQAVLLKAAPSLQFIGQLLGIEVPSEVATNVLQQRVAELDQVSEPLDAHEWAQLVSDTVAQTLLLAGGLEAPSAIGHATMRAAQAAGDQPEVAPGPSPEDLMVPDGYGVVSEEPIAQAPTAAQAPVAAAPSPEQAPAEIAAPAPAERVPAGFEVVSEEPAPAEVAPQAPSTTADAVPTPSSRADLREERARLEEELRGTDRGDPRFGEILSRLDDIQVEEKIAGQPTAPTRPKLKPGQRPKADAKTMDVLQFIAAKQINGRYGIDWDEAAAHGLDPADMRDSYAHGIFRPFVKGGASFDAMAEALDEAGYPVRERIDGQMRYTPNKVLEVLDRALRGEKIFAGTAGYDAMAAERDRQIAEQEKNAPYVPTNAELVRDGRLQPTEENRIDAAQVTRAVEVDEVAVERLAVQYEKDDAGFMRAIKELLDAHDSNAEIAGNRQGGQEEAGIQAARVPDLFGADVTAVNQRNRRVQRKLGEGREAVPPEQAPPGDIFRQQADQEAAAAAASQTRIDELTNQVLEQPGMQDKVRADTIKNRERIAGEDETQGSRQGMAAGVGAQYVPLIQQAGAATAATNNFTLGLRGQAQRTVVIPAKPIRRESAMHAIENAFGVKIYQGKPFRGAMLGFYRPKTGEVRIKAHHDIEVTAHEFFHWLDRQFPAIRSLYHRRQFHDELMGVSYDKSKIFEGFAEFGRLYLTQESQAAAKAPQFYDAFVKTAEQLGILAKLHRAQNVMHAWYLQGAEARALSKIGPQVKSFNEWWESNTRGLVDRELQKGLDWLHSIKVVERTVTGGIQDATISPYGAARLVAGARGVVKAVLNHGTIAFGKTGDIEFTGPGLRQVFEPVADAFDETMAYFVAQRADELRGQGRERLLSQDEINALREIARRSEKYDLIQQAFEDYQAFNDRMMLFYIQTGLTSAERAVAMREANKSYVPFHRILESLESPQGGAPRGAFFRLKGGTQNLRDTWENIVGNVNALVASGLRNHAKQLLYKTIESNRAGQFFAVRVATEQHGTMVQPVRVLRQVVDKISQADPQARAALDDLLDHIAEDPSLAESIMYWSGKYRPSAPDIDMVLVNGKPRYYQIGDPLLMETMQLWNSPRPTNLALRILGGFSGTLRRGVTSMPDFMIPNLLRDTTNAYTLSKGGQLPFIGSIRGMVEAIQHDEAMWDFLANGGGFANLLHADAGAIRRRLERMYVNHGIDYKAVLDTPQKLLDLFDTVGSAFEYGTRIAEYKAMREKGATKRQAALEARDISTDFAMRGSSELVRWVTTGVAFMNAGMEGLYRIQREIAEKGGRVRFNPKQTMRFALRGIIGLTLPSILLWLRNHDDERYKSLPQWIKLTHWVWLVGDTAYLIPKPFEIGATFATIPEQTLEYIKDKNGARYAEALAYLVQNAFRLDPTPTAVRGPVEIARNKDFSGRPIVSEALQDVAPEEQFNAYTSETAIAIGQKFGISPVKFDHLVRSYFGTLGLYALGISDQLVDPSIGIGEKPESHAADWYVLRRFVRQSPYRGTDQEQEFYKVLEESRQVVATFNKIKGDARAQDAERYLQDGEKRVLYGARASIEGVAKQAAAINDAMRKVRLSTTMTAEAKRDKLDQLQIEKNRLFDVAALELNRGNVTELGQQQRTGTD